MLSTGVAWIDEEFPGLKCAQQASHKLMMSSLHKTRPAGVAEINEEFLV